MNTSLEPVTYTDIMKKLTAESSSVKFLEQTITMTSHTTTPASFQLLLPEILTILRANVHHLIKNSAYASIAVGNLTTATVAPDSEGDNSDFICQLEYCIMPQPAPSQGQHSIIINFTTGEVMSEKRYVELLFSEKGHPPLSEPLYGKLLASSLTQAWDKGLEEEPDFLSLYNRFPLEASPNDSNIHKTSNLGQVVNYCYQAMGFLFHPLNLVTQTQNTNINLKNISIY